MSRGRLGLRSTGRYVTQGGRTIKPLLALFSDNNLFTIYCCMVPPLLTYFISTHIDIKVNTVGMDGCGMVLYAAPSVCFA